MFQHVCHRTYSRMKLPRWLLAAALLVLFSPALGLAGTGLPQNYYVSPGGTDTWSGKLPAPNETRTDGPFATLTRARDAIRSLKASSQFNAPVTVILLGGKYWLREALVLESQDSGTSEQPITYTAYPGDKPVLSGGRRINGWKPFRGKILQVHLSEVLEGKWKFRQLFYEGHPQIRARWPNFDPQDPLYGGWAFVEAPLPTNSPEPYALRYQPTAVAPRPWAKPSQAEMKVIPWLCWADDLIPLKEIDRKNSTITLARPVQPSFMALLKGNRFYVENVLEELDQPGEWCLDSETGTLYFWPPGPIEKAEVVAPVTDRLIELRGSAADPIRFVNISGLTLTETLSPWPEQRHENFHSPIQRGEAIRLENAEDCRIENNFIHTVGGDGVRLQGYTARNQIVDNEIAYTGAAGISLASDSIGNVTTWADTAELQRVSALYPKAIRNVISNNHIHHTGVIKKNGGAIHLYALNSVDNVISHNFIHDTADKAMTMQDGFGPFRIEFNEMRNLAREISDTGAIMTNRWFILDDNPELGGRIVIRYNLIRDVLGCGAYDKPREGQGVLQTKAGGKIWTPYYNWGIYFDNSGNNRTVFGNIIIGTVLGGISMPVGDPKDNLFENNILVNGKAHGADLRIDGKVATGNRFVRNIVYYTGPQTAALKVTPQRAQALAECDFNLYFPAAGQPLKILGVPDGSFQQWQELGFDKHSVIADPLFVNPAAGDFRLKPDSPAFKLGFRLIDVQQIGLMGKMKVTSSRDEPGQR